MEPSFVGFLVFAIICLSMALQMQSGTAAISCDLGETSITAGMSNKCDDCREDLQTKCGLQGRVVSHLECNAPDPKKPKERVCEGCCRVPLPCPPQPPAKWTECQATDTDKTFRIENYSGNDCKRCQDGCKSRCDAIGARVGDQMCGFLDNGKTYVGLYCTCCCRENVPYPPPPPPTPSPPPSPSPPPPTPENICKLEDIYVAFRLSNPRSCNSCSTDCKAKCSGLGSSMTSQECITKSSYSLCKCCCKIPPPTPSPPPPSPPPPPPSSPPPPPTSFCNAGDKFLQITYYDTNKDCGLCKSDCTVKPTPVSCKCCCTAGSTGATTSLFSLAN